MRYRLFLDKITFMFLDKKSLLNFAGVLFSNCIDRSKLYEDMIQWNTTAIYKSCFTESMTEEEQIQVLNALEVLEENYSQVYDPDRVLFNSEHKIRIN